MHQIYLQTGKKFPGTTEGKDEYGRKMKVQRYYSAYREAFISYQILFLIYYNAKVSANLKIKVVFSLKMMNPLYARTRVSGQVTNTDHLVKNSHFFSTRLCHSTETHSYAVMLFLYIKDQC